MALIRHPRRRPRSTYRFPREEAIKFTLADFRKAKRSGKPLEVIDISVKCLGGKSHTIRFSFPGGVKFMHHPDIQSEITMQKLGGDQAECLKFMKAFRANPISACGGRYYAMKLLYAIEQVKNLKQTERSQYVDEFTTPMIDRLKTKLSDIFKNVEKRLVKKYAASMGRGYYSSYGGYTTLDGDEAEEKQLVARLKLVFEDQRNKQGGKESNEEKR